MDNSETYQYTSSKLAQAVILMSQYINPSSGVDVGKQLGFSDRYFDAMFTVAAKYYENNRLDDALKIAQQLISLQASEHRNYKLMGACLQAKEDYRSAMRVYIASLSLAIQDAEIYFYLGQCEFLTKEFTRAAKSLAHASELCAQEPSKWEHIALHVNELLARAQSRAQT